MSSQRGNAHRHRPQKHANSKAFVNNLHDTSKLIEKLSQLEMHGLCQRCKEIIEWKIKYKKYKPLTKPSTCVKCSQRNIKRAYYTVCETCIASLHVCGKCAQNNEIVVPLPNPKEEETERFFFANLKKMRERERRTILRIMESKKEDTDSKVAEYLDKVELSSNREKLDEDFFDSQDENSDDDFNNSDDESE
ncbi:unnamed protein product [Rodentolepis nana]|uniref:C2H2-type domain-containing protein n=1 Tax=Rodentolepis nana TaxID=102285 RepID=A0A0R3TJU1_RODNA|nr:unnamed protein product [Rodentolepis nana]